jgi:hypothetical protein
MTLTKHLLLGEWYVRRLIVHQQRFDSVIVIKMYTSNLTRTTNESAETLPTG